LNLEVEIKLAITESRIPLLQQHTLLQYPVTPSKNQTLISTYFDTPDILLRKNGFALRIREDKGQYTQTLKSSAPSENGLTTRQEWEWPLADFALDLSLISVDSLRKLLSEPQVKATLAPRFTTQFNRTTWDINFQQSRVEIALDIGQVIAGNRTAPIQEVELELKAGNNADLQALANRFIADLGLAPENRSKAARGYSLL
jgi:inorganic triphosphatase YgiF